MKSFDKIFSKHNTIPFTPNNTDLGGVDITLIKAFNNELISLGYICSAKLLQKLTTLSENSFVKLKNKTLNAITSIKGIRNHKPLYPSFPNIQTVPDDDFKRIIHNFLSQEQISSGVIEDIENSFLLGCGHLINRKDWDMSFYDKCPICGEGHIDDDMKKKPALTENTSITILEYKNLSDIVSNDISNILASKTILSADNMEYLENIMEDFPIIFKETASNTEDIPVKEISTLVSKYLYNAQNTPLNSIRFIKTSTDLLRFLVSLNNGDISLLGKIRFGKFDRKLRKEIVEHLDSLNELSLVEDLLRYKGLWKTIGKAIHVFEYKKYVKVISAFMVLRETKLSTTTLSHNNKYKAKNDKLTYQNFASRINSYFDDKQLPQLLSLLKTRPSEFARTMDRCLVHFKDEYKSINKSFSEIVDDISTPVLISLYNNLNARKSSIGKRFITTKKEVLVETDNRPIIDNDDLNTIIVSSLSKRLNQNNVLVDTRLRNIVLPLSERITSKQLVNLPKGSKVVLDSSKTLRLFLHWIESSYRVDLDLSVVMYDNNFKMIDYCDYTHKTACGNKVIHSGDHTSAPAPNGASEFIDLDLAALKAQGIRYIASEIYSYSNTVFDELNGAMVGFMMRSSVMSGETYDARTVSDKFDLTGNSLIRLPYLIDLSNNTLIWVDAERRDRINNPNVSQANQSLSEFLPTFLHYHNDKLSVYDLALLSATNLYIYHAPDNKVYLNGKEVDIKDIIFDRTYMYSDNDISDLKTDSIYSLYRTQDVKYLDISNLI